MKHLLEVDSVLKVYDKKTVLSDVYLKCETGDIIGVLGRNGTGKSTLLKIIYGIISTENKFVRIDSKVRRKAYLYNNEISYLPQNNFIPKYFKVSKVIKLFLDKGKISDFNKDDFIQKIYSKKIKTLSGGELRYLEIRLILFKESKFVLLDEPFSNISPIFIKKINKLIIKYSKQKGIIITDHNYKNVLFISTQLYLLRDSAIRKLKNKEELIKFGYLREGML